MSGFNNGQEFLSYFNKIKNKEKLRVQAVRDRQLLMYLCPVIAVVGFGSSIAIKLYNYSYGDFLMMLILGVTAGLLWVAYKYMNNTYEEDPLALENRVTLEISTVDALKTNGWQMSHDIDQVTAELALGSHIGIIGRYKSGKSTIIGLLADEPVDLGSEVNHTRGIHLYKLLVNQKQVIAKDTEGLFQILGVEDPYFRQDVITNILKESCTHLIVLFETITTQDRPLLDEIIGLMVNSSNVDRVTIVHNVKSIKSVRNLRKYADNLCSCIDVDLQEDLTARQEVNVGRGNNRIEKIVDHLFLCDFQAEPEHNYEKIKQLRTLVSGTSTHKVNLKRCLKSSICSTLIRRYDGVKNNHLTIENNYIKYNGVLQQRHGIVGDALNKAIKFRRYLPDPEEDQVMCKIRYVVDCGSIDENSVTVVINSEQQLKVVVQKYDEQTKETKDITDYLDLPVEISLSDHPSGDVDTVKRSEHNSVYFDVYVNKKLNDVDSLDNLLRLGG